jgi:hypothetical protein
VRTETLPAARMRMRPLAEWTSVPPVTSSSVTLPPAVCASTSASRPCEVRSAVAARACSREPLGTVTSTASRLPRPKTMRRSGTATVSRRPSPDSSTRVRSAASCDPPSSAVTRTVLVSVSAAVTSIVPSALRISRSTGAGVEKLCGVVMGFLPLAW